MSKIPDTPRTKYNRNDPFRWVDSQWKKFMDEQKEHKSIIKQLQKDLSTCNKHFQIQREKLIKSEENFRRLERLYTFGTPTDELEVGSPEDYGDAPIIYESPDGGKTIYQRRAGDYENKELVGGEQMELFKKQKKNFWSGGEAYRS